MPGISDKQWRSEIKSTIAKHGQQIIAVEIENGDRQCFLYTIGNTRQGAPEFYLACHKTLLPVAHTMLDFLHSRVTTGHPVLDGHLIANEATDEGIIWEARRVRGAELVHFNDKLVCQAKHYFRREVEVLELVPSARRPMEKFANVSLNVMQKHRICSGCGVRSAPQSSPMRKCGKCLAAYYCSKECQTKDWKFHKGMCE